MSEEVIEKTYAEQIAQKNKKKKIIISTLSLSLVFMIALAFIVMAVVRVDLKPTVVTNPDRIYFNGKTTSQYIPTTNEYQDFMEEYDKTFGISYLTALFSGRLGGYEILEDKLSTLPAEVTNEDYVTFVYKFNNVTLTNSNGTTYYSKYNSNYSIDFYEVSFALSKENKIQDITMYLKYDWQTEGSSTAKTYFAEVKLKANTYGLYTVYSEM